MSEYLPDPISFSDDGYGYSRVISLLFFWNEELIIMITFWKIFSHFTFLKHSTDNIVFVLSTLGERNWPLNRHNFPLMLYVQHWMIMVYIFFPNMALIYFHSIYFVLSINRWQFHFLDWKKKCQSQMWQMQTPCVYSKIRKKNLIIHHIFCPPFKTNFLIIFIDISRYLWIYDSKMNSKYL